MFDLFGRCVATLVDDQMMPAGKYNEQFEAAEYNLPGGVYYLTLRLKDQVQNQKMLLIE